MRKCDTFLKGRLNLPNVIISYCNHFPANDILHFSLQLKTIPHCISAPHFLYSFYVGEHFFKTGRYYRDWSPTGNPHTLVS